MSAMLVVETINIIIIKKKYMWQSYTNILKYRLLLKN